MSKPLSSRGAACSPEGALTPAQGESPSDLSRDEKVWLAGVRHWLDPEDRERANAVARTVALTDLMRACERAHAHPLLTDAAPPASVVESLLKQAAESLELRREKLSEAFAAGLELRVGRSLALPPPGDQGWDYLMLQWFWQLGVDFPPGVSCCWTCLFVSRPRRKSSAWTCERCHSRPLPEPLVPEERDDGGFDYAVPTTTGWRVERIRECESCGAPFAAKRADARYCPGSSACRESARRKRTREGSASP